MAARPQGITSPFLEDWLLPQSDESGPAIALLQSETPFGRGMADRPAYQPPPQSLAPAGDDEGGHDDEEAFDELAPRADDEALSLLPTMELDGRLDEWLSEAREGADDIPGSIAVFAATLARERAGLGKKDAAEEERNLLADYRDTIAGARARFGTKLGKGAFTIEGIGRAWMISRQEETGFLYRNSAKRMAAMAAPKGVALGAHPLVGSSDKAPVAPFTGRFMEELKRRFPKVSAQNYRGHGSAGFVDLGHSLDLYIDGRDGRGFYPPASAVDFLRELHEAAATVGARWRAIYNDFTVAKAINDATGERNVIFVGKARLDRQKRATGLNWHGPDPLILHFHLDIAPRAGDSARPASISVAAVAPAATAPAPSAVLARFAQRVLNAAENEHLTVDGKLGPLTRGAIERFRRRAGLGTGGALDSRTGIALVQRALEELAQQSMFALGESDGKTLDAIRRFKAENGLPPDSTLDDNTYEALALAIGRRPSPRAAATTVPTAAPAAPTASGSQRMAQAMKLLVERYGYPEEGAAGIVGNLSAESGVIPNRIEGSRADSPMRAPDFRAVTRDFTPEEVKNRDKAKGIGPRAPGIGLAQWTTPSRRMGLFKHAFQGQVLDLAILDRMDAQVDYLVSELKKFYPVLDALLRKPGTSVDTAAEEVVYNFEVPGAILDDGTPRRRLPRDHASVQKVFRERRKPSHEALAAFRATPSETDFAHEEHDVEEYLDLMEEEA